MYRNILVPVVFDGEPDVTAPIELAEILATPNAYTTFLHVVEQVPPYAISYITEDLQKELRVSMAIRKGASSGDRMRLKGKGIKTRADTPGDQFVRLKIVLPDTVDAEMEEIALRWRDHADFDSRAEMRRKT